MALETDRPFRLTGGCQCGAVRFACHAPPQNVHVCHCRMCQKAVGGPFAVICPVEKAQFVVTRGQLSWFHSSALARRGFCRECGTPMIFDYPEAPDIGVLAGCFDDPDAVPPVVQYGNESRRAWYGGLAGLPGDAPTYAVDPKGYLPRIAASNRQHPDHETAGWETAVGETAAGETAGGETAASPRSAPGPLSEPPPTG